MLTKNRAQPLKKFIVSMVGRVNPNLVAGEFQRLPQELSAVLIDEIRKQRRADSRVTLSH